jgi:hypothetical protein
MTRVLTLLSLLFFTASLPASFLIASSSAFAQPQNPNLPPLPTRPLDAPITLPDSRVQIIPPTPQAQGDTPVAIPNSSTQRQPNCCTGRYCGPGQSCICMPNGEWGCR